MPVAQPGAPKCPPFASLCECNKNHYYYYAMRCGLRSTDKNNAKIRLEM